MSRGRTLRAGPLAVPLVVAGVVPTLLGLGLPGPAVPLPRAAAGASDRDLPGPAPDRGCRNPGDG